MVGGDGVDIDEGLVVLVAPVVVLLDLVEEFGAGWAVVG